MRQKKICYILLCVVLCALTMGIIDGIVQPGYVTKSAIKAALFLLGPLGYFYLFPQERTHAKALLRPQGKAVLFALALGAAVYGIILGGYFLLRQALDIDAIALQLTADGGVRAEDFLWISLYICLVNSALEELLFRGFAFFCLKDLTSRPFAYLFSAVVFAGYHFGMFAGSNAPPDLAAGHGGPHRRRCGAGLPERTHRQHLPLLAGAYVCQSGHQHRGLHRFRDDLSGK